MLNFKYHSKKHYKLTTLRQFLQEFLPTYNTCQLFVLAVKQNEIFVNVLTSMQFSYQSDVQYSQNWSLIEKAFQKSDDVAFLHRDYKPSNIYKFLTRPLRVRYSPMQPIQYEPFNSLELNVSNRVGSRKLDSKWKTFEAYKRNEDKTQELWQTIDEHKGLVNQYGYRDIPEFRREVFGTDREDTYFQVELPIYVCIDKLTHQEIKVQKHHEMNNLQINLLLSRANHSYNNIERTQVILNNSDNGKREILTTTSPFMFQRKTKYKDIIVASLINTKIPELRLDEESIYVPFERATESFSRVVFEFYPSKDLKEHLFTPEQFKNPDDVFQDAVVKLLSLAGYSVIILGKKQYIRDTGEKTKVYETLQRDTGYFIGSADIIAYRENELLIIDCTIGAPDEKKIKKLPELIYHLESRSLDVPIDIVSIIVTPRDYTYDDEEKVRIVDRLKLEGILDAILMNNVKDARYKLMELQRRSPVSL